MDEMVFRKKMTELVLDTLHSTWDVMIAEHDRFRDEFISSFNGRPEHLKEGQRRICESKITEFCKAAPRQVFDCVWREMLELGFSDPDRQATMAFYRADWLCGQGSEADGEFDAAIALLRDAMQAFKANGENKQYEFHAGVLQRLQQQRALPLAQRRAAACFDSAPVKCPHHPSSARSSA